jgi:GT2 family glycosyltransferase
VRFTIVTPVRNGMPWLPECITSVDSQRGTVDVQHIVQDPGSTDGSRAWLREHASPGLEVFEEADDGQTDALARGFARADGEILGWLNADDVLEAGALARVADVFAQNPDAVAVTGACLLIDPEGAVTGTIPVPPDLSLDGLVNSPWNPAQPATFFRAEAYRRVGGLDRRLDFAMDVDLWLRLAASGRIVALPGETLARFRRHPTAKTVTQVAATIREDFRLRRRHGLRLVSPVGREMIRVGYVRPALRPLRRSARWLLGRFRGHPPSG